MFETGNDLIKKTSLIRNVEKNRDEKLQRAAHT
jgi:hypothetical protein